MCQYSPLMRNRKWNRKLKSKFQPSPKVGPANWSIWTEARFVALFIFCRTEPRFARSQVLKIYLVFWILTVEVFHLPFLGECLAIRCTGWLHKNVKISIPFIQIISLEYFVKLWSIYSKFWTLNLISLKHYLGIQFFHFHYWWYTTKHIIVALLAWIIILTVTTQSVACSECPRGSDKLSFSWEHVYLKGQLQKFGISFCLYWKIWWIDSIQGVF